MGIRCAQCAKRDAKLQEVEEELNLPPWHKAELGSPFDRKLRASNSLPFLEGRLPSEAESKSIGYKSTKDWYRTYRKSVDKKLTDAQIDEDWTTLQLLVKRDAVKFPEESSEEEDEVDC